MVADTIEVGCETSVRLDASGSSHGHPERAIVEYEWDLDFDGAFTTDANTGPVPTFVVTFTEHGRRGLLRAPARWRPSVL